MNYQAIITMPVASLGHLSYAQFVETFTACNAEIERLEALQAKEYWVELKENRALLIHRLEKAKETLTMHRHYEAYCSAMDKRHYDAVYHRPLLRSA